MLFRVLPKPRDNQSGLVLLTRSAVSGQKVVRFFRHRQLNHPGQAFPSARALP